MTLTNLGGIYRKMTLKNCSLNKSGFCEDLIVPTRSIVLTHEQDEFVESIVRAGEYQDANEAIRDALRVFQQRRQEDALKLDALRTLIRAGTNALEQGEFTEVEDNDLVRFLEVLASRQGGSAR